MFSRLDAPAFAKRAKAMDALGRMEQAAAKHLHKVLAGKPTLEMRLRVEKLLKETDEPFAPSRLLASWRAVTVLEQLDTPKARQLLEVLAGGAPEARLTRLARTALDCLKGGTL